MPTFESGRLAGLGLDPAGATHASQSAWKTTSSARQPALLLPLVLPHRLAGRLRVPGAAAGAAAGRQARRACATSTCSRPGSNIPGITDADLHGILKLGGALRVPRSSFTEDELTVVDRYENWDHGRSRRPPTRRTSTPTRTRSRSRSPISSTCPTTTRPRPRRTPTTPPAWPAWPATPTRSSRRRSTAAGTR